MNDSLATATTDEMLDLDETMADDLAVSRYDSAPVSGDQRKSYRYPAQPGRDVATVRIGRNSWKGKLCEESAGGMAIETTGKSKLKIDDEVEVGIYTGWYRARVIHTQEISDGHRIGLQRISIISTEDDSPRRKRGSGSPSQWRSMVAVAFLAMALGIGGSQYFESWFGAKKAPAAHGIPTHFAHGENTQLQGVLDGVNLLLEPHVAEGLKLSETQQDSIQGVLIGASNSLSKAHEDSQNQPPEVWYRESQAIVNSALENILCGLTDEQILKWRALMIHRRKSQS